MQGCNAEPRDGRRRGPACTLAFACLVLTFCAAPPVTLYTPGRPAVTVLGTPLGPKATVIVVARITIPDDLASQDIPVRRGSVLENSHSSRWASRLSVEATAMLAAQLARRRPDARVTDQPHRKSGGS